MALYEQFRLNRVENHSEPRFRLVTPATVKRTVAPKGPPNRDLRSREYLTEAEVERLMKAAQVNRHGHRDATMLLVVQLWAAARLG
jgi:hypothetical protein